MADPKILVHDDGNCKGGGKHTPLLDGYCPDAAGDPRGGEGRGREARATAVPGGGLGDLARIAVEFDYHLRLAQHDQDGIFKGDPPSRGFWTVKMGRLNLRRDGKWSYYCRAGDAKTARERRYVQMQRFITLEEAVRVATRVFGRDPEHAAWMRGLYKEE